MGAQFPGDIVPEEIDEVFAARQAAHYEVLQARNEVGERIERLRRELWSAERKGAATPDGYRTKTAEQEREVERLRQELSEARQEWDEVSALETRVRREMREGGPAKPPRDPFKFPLIGLTLNRK